MILQCAFEELRALREGARTILGGDAPTPAAVAAYFDFAHSLSVLGRIQELGAEMEAMIELVTGAPATPEIAMDFQFPD